MVLDASVPTCPLKAGAMQPGSFGYDEKAYIDALEQFVQAIDLKGPYAVVTHGYAFCEEFWQHFDVPDLLDYAALCPPASHCSMLCVLVGIHFELQDSMYDIGVWCHCRFVLGQYGLLWALKHADDISHLVILGTPLGVSTSLRPELAPYKSPVPFLRPKPDSKFAGDLFNAAGLAYVIAYDDAQVCPQHSRNT